MSYSDDDDDDDDGLCPELPRRLMRGLKEDFIKKIFCFERSFVKDEDGPAWGEGPYPERMGQGQYEAPECRAAHSDNCNLKCDERGCKNTVKSSDHRQRTKTFFTLSGPSWSGRRSLHHRRHHPPIRPPTATSDSRYTVVTGITRANGLRGIAGLRVTFSQENTLMNESSGYRQHRTHLFSLQGHFREFVKMSIQQWRVRLTFGIIIYVTLGTS